MLEGGSSLETGDIKRADKLEFCKISSIQETRGESRSPTPSWEYCSDTKGVGAAYIRFELDSTQQLSGIQIPPNKWSYTKDQSGHIA